MFQEPILAHNRISFSLRANGVQTILMSVKMLPCTPGSNVKSMLPLTASPVHNSRESSNAIRVLGQLLVCEDRNMDITKTISYSLSMYLDAEEFKQRCEQQKAEEPAKTPVMRPDLTGDSSTMSELELAQGVQPAEIDEDASTLVVSTAHIDMGDLTVAARARSSFSVFNRSDSATRFMLMVEREGRSKRDVLSFSIMSGEVAAGGTVVVHVTCTPVMPGRQLHVVKVRDILNKKDTTVSFSLCAAGREYLVFPGTKKGCINVGAVHVERNGASEGDGASSGYCKVVPINVMSIHHEAVYLRARTNMKRQAYIWADEDLSVKVNSLKIDAYSGTRLWFAILPFHVLDDVNASYDFGTGDCREIVGGVNFELFLEEDNDNDNDNLTFLGEITLRFTAVLGRSTLAVSPSQGLDLGTIALDAVAQGSITLSTVNTLMSIPFTITPTSELIVVTPSAGELLGSEMPVKPDGRSGTSSMEVKITMPTSEPGWWQEKLLIKDMNTTEPPIELPVSLFVDDGSVHASNPRGAEEETTETLHLKKLEATTETLHFGDIYVQESPEGGTVGETQHGEVALTLQVTESLCAGSVLMLYPESELLGIAVSSLTPLDDAAIEVDACSSVADDDALRDAPATVDQGRLAPKAGAAFAVKVGEKAQLRVSLDPAAADACAQMGAGSEEVLMLELSGKVAFYSETLERTIKRIDVQGAYHVSVGKLVEDSVHVGSVGYLTDYQAAPFSITVQNRSKLPLHYHFVDLPAEIELQEGEALRGEVPAEGRCTVHASLCTSADTAMGANSWKVCMYEVGRQVGR